MVWGRFAVPNVSVIPACLEERLALTAPGVGSGTDASIFECYGGWHYRNKHATIKTMHHTLACPNTDFHFSCSHSCPCGKQYQSSCSLMHLRPMHSYKFHGNEPQLQFTKSRYAAPGNTAARPWVVPKQDSGNGDGDGDVPATNTALGDKQTVELADIWRNVNVKTKGIGMRGK